MTDDNDNEIQVVESSPSVGKRLQQAREEKNFTIAEVAVQLRFTKDIVVALEKQQWEKLHGRTYARGYFTNYVKFLGLPHDEMLAAFNIEYTVRDNEPKLTTTNVAGESQFPWVPVVILVLMLLVGWFAYQQWRATQEDKSPAAEQSNAADSASEGDDFTPSVVQPLGKSDAATTSASEATQTVTPATTATAPTQDSSDATSTESMTPVTPQTSAEPETTNGVQTAQQKTQSTLELAFSDKCWVEITDDSSKVLVNKIMNANDDYKLTTSEPVHVLLGKASAATVKFNQKPVDISSYIQGDVARFTLGADS